MDVLNFFKITEETCKNEGYGSTHSVLLMYSRTLFPSSGLISVVGNGQLKATSGLTTSTSDMMFPTPLASRTPEPSQRASQKTILPATMSAFMESVMQYLEISGLEPMV